MTQIPYKIRNGASALRGLQHWLSVHVLRRHFFFAHIRQIGLRFKVPSNTIFSWHLAKYQSFEAENTNALLSILNSNSGGIFVDVGANFGWYTCLFSKLAGDTGLVYAIEPDESNLSLLRENIESNCLRNVTIWPHAVSSEEGELPLHKAPATNPGMHSFITQKHTPGRHDDQQVKVTTLDTLMADITAPIEVLKIDIEGFEINAMRGASETLRRCKHLVIEYSPGFLRAAGQSPQEFFSLILEAGLEIFTIVDRQLQPVSADNIKGLLDRDQSEYYWQRDFICSRRSTQLPRKC